MFSGGGIPFYGSPSTSSGCCFVISLLRPTSVTVSLFLPKSFPLFSFIIMMTKLCYNDNDFR